MTRFQELDNAHAKAILWVRCSTNHQEKESQEADLRRMALADGFKAENLIVIGSIGSSARSLNALYLADISKMSTTLRNDEEVTHLYAWEVSRIARRESKFFEVKELVESLGVQLVIYSPSMRLFEPNGEINSGAAITFTILATWAKQEMEEKRARFARGKQRNKETGRYCGSRYMLYGVKTDENGFYVEEPQQAKIVRDIFRRYAHGDISVDNLAKELNERGITTQSGLKWTQPTLNKLLKNAKYTGKYTNKDGTEVKYPVIVSQELFDLAQAKLRENCSTTAKVSKGKSHHFASRILMCRNCGSNYTFHGAAYGCYHHIYHNRLGVEDCTQAPTINAKHMDTILWKLAKIYNQRSVIEQQRVDRDYAEKQISELNSLKGVQERELKRLDEKSERVIDAFIEGTITKNKRDIRLDEIAKEREVVTGKIADFNTRIEQFAAVSSGSTIRAPKLKYTDKEKFDIVHDFIKCATLERVERFLVRVDVTDRYGHHIIINYNHTPRKATAIVVDVPITKGMLGSPARGYAGRDLLKDSMSTLICLGKTVTYKEK